MPRKLKWMVWALVKMKGAMVGNGERNESYFYQKKIAFRANVRLVWMSETQRPIKASSSKDQTSTRTGS